MNTLPHTSSKLGVRCTISSSLKVSSKGEVLGMHVTDGTKYQLLKQNMDTGMTMFYNYTHQKCTISLVLIEQRNVVFTGGDDRTLVAYNYQTGEVLKTMDLRIRDISSLFKIGEVVCVGGNRTVKFVDSHSLNQIETQQQIATDCQYVYCMDFMSIIEKTKGINQQSAYLFMGGSKSGAITRSIIPKEIINKHNIKIPLTKDQQIKQLTKQNNQLKLKNKELSNENIKYKNKNIELTNKITSITNDFQKKLDKYSQKKQQYKMEIKDAQNTANTRISKINKIKNNFKKTKKVIKLNLLIKRASSKQISSSKW